MSRNWKRSLTFWLPMLALALLSWVAPGCDGDDDGGPDPEPTGCARDADCPDAATYCYIPLGKTLGTCSQGCRQDPDTCAARCQEGEDPQCDPARPPACNDQHICVYPEVPCSPGDCEPGKFCNVQTGACEAGCEDDTACTGDCQVCDVSTHTCKIERICTDHAECPDKYWCDATGCGICREGCVDTNDCSPDKPYCVNHKCQACEDCPSPCDDSSEDERLHCSSGWYCDETNECDKKCSDDASCRAELGPDYVCCKEEGCPAQRCVLGCIEGDPVRGCASGFTCLASGHCTACVCCDAQGNADDRKCRATEICVSAGPDFGTCHAGCRSSDDGRCDANQYCSTIDTIDGVCEQGCWQDEQCAAHLACDVGLHVCIPRPCLGDAGCPAAYYCGPISQVCTLGCRTGAEDTCGEGEVCDPVTRLCVEACGGDEDCEAGEVCDPASRRCVVGCRPDAREGEGGNESAATAFLLEPDAEGLVTLTDLRLCGYGQWEDDWYAIELAEERLTATLFLVDEELLQGDVELMLVDVDGVTVLDRRATLGQASVSVSFPDLPHHTGVYFLHVAGVRLGEETVGIDYRLEAQLVGPGECAADWAEGETGNEGWETARPMASGTYDTLTLCPGLEAEQVPPDVDWFSFTLKAGDGLSAKLTHPAEAVLGMELWGPGEFGPELLVHGSPLPGEGDPEVVPPGRQLAVAQIYVAGTYFLRVAALQPSSVTYTLKLTLNRLNEECVDDGFEENDLRPYAVELTGPLYRQAFEDLLLCAGDEDWYKVELQLGDILIVETDQLDPDGGNLDLELYVGASRLLSATNNGPHEGLYLVVDGVALFPDMYYVRVFGRTARAQNRYTLTVSRELDPEQCVPDRLEPDNTPATATRAGCGSRVDDVMSCWDDDDLFRVETLQYGMIEAQIDYIAAAGELGVNLYRLVNGELASLAEGEVGEDRTTVVRHDLDPGTYYLEVVSFGLPNRYSLAVACEREEPPCQPDEKEINDSPLSAATVRLPRDWDGTLLPQDTILWDMRVCSVRDADWFQFRVHGTDHLDILARFFHFSSGDLSLDLYCPKGPGQPADLDLPVASSDRTADNENVVYNVPILGAFECTTHADCNQEDVCVDHYCVAQENPTCTLNGADCMLGDVCAAGTDRAGNPRNYCVPAPCDEDSECFDEEICAEGQCIPKGVGICYVRVEGVPQNDIGAPYSLHFRPYVPCSIAAGVDSCDTIDVGLRCDLNTCKTFSEDQHDVMMSAPCCQPE